MAVLADGIPVYCAHDAVVAVEQVRGNPRNPNTHPDKQIEMLSRIIKAQGWRAPITVSNRSGFIVRGHGRLAAALLLGVSEVPVDYQDYATDAEEWADLIADNRIAELAEIDYALLKDLIVEVDGELDAELTGFTHDELNEMMGWTGDLEDLYTHKAEGLRYEPMMEEPPPITELADTTKYEQLVAALKESELPEDVKQFLALAAHRHVVFDYGKIAEFFAHADAEVQRAMRDSALVIIDIQDAIRQGLTRFDTEVEDMIDGDG